jgi:hypothetical protein
MTSRDLGLQNLVKRIDPMSRRKTIEESSASEPGDVLTLCPHFVGAKSWIPGSSDESSRTLYVPLAEACMDGSRRKFVSAVTPSAPARICSNSFTAVAK